MLAVIRLAAVGLCAVAAASAVQAQRTLKPAPATVAPSPGSLAARAAPNPAGLRPVFPAGISSGSGAAVSSDPIAASTSPIPAGTAPPRTAAEVLGGRRIFGGTAGDGTLPFDATAAAAATSVMGAGATVRGPGQRVEGGAGGFSATDVARSFFYADANKDGDLTRAEAARLSISTMPFEEMDRNFDQLISRFEYEDSVR